MQHRLLKVGLAGASAIAATLAIAVPPASADYAPTSHDVVGVGSDTLQYIGDFVADGSYTGSAGYNGGLNKYKVINFDATPDANARLAYGPDGANVTSCAPGTGATQGTGGQTANHTDQPCVLDPSVVLRAGTKPVQRPNGSGDGAKAFAGDTTSGRDWVTYSRASSNQDSTLPSSSYDVMKAGNDPLDILTSTTTNAVPLSSTELGAIYTCSITNWTQLDNSQDAAHTYGTIYYTQADVDNNGFVPADHPGAVKLTSGTIVPIIPQVGSGTRSSFEGLIGVTDSQVVNATGTGAGKCVKVGEENDPTAISAQGAGEPNAIEPMSGGRLNLFDGIAGATNTATGKGGFFVDPTCKILASGVPGNSGTGTDCTAGTDGTSGSGTSVRVTGAPIVPAVNLVSTGNPPDDQTGGSGAVATTVFTNTRALYIYFRKADVDSITAWQPGTTLNQVRTLFYNPCDPATSNNGGPGVSGGPGFTAADCVTIGSTSYGPGGQPYYAKSAGQTDISAAGVSPTYGVSTTGTSGTFS